MLIYIVQYLKVVQIRFKIIIMPPIIKLIVAIFNVVYVVA